MLIKQKTNFKYCILFVVNIYNYFMCKIVFKFKTKKNSNNFYIFFLIFSLVCLKLRNEMIFSFLIFKCF